jgi:predicted phage tail protein
LTAAPTNASGQVLLSWSVPASDGAAAITDYTIERSPNGASGWQTINDGTGATTSYTVTGLSDGMGYYFRVAATNAAGGSAPSNVAHTIPRSVASAPQALTATPGASGQVRLAWSAPSSNGGAAVTDYVIQRSVNSGGPWVPVSDGVSATTSYTATGLSNGTRYYFRVAAHNAAGTSAFSNTPNAIPRTVPTAGVR